MCASRTFEFEFQRAIDIVVALSERYLEEDLAPGNEILGVEYEYTLTSPGLAGHHGFIDLIIKLPDGRVKIPDWKTTGSLSDYSQKDFKDRCRHSWQSRYYDLAARECFALPEDTVVEVEYRGIAVEDLKQLVVQGITSGEWRARALDRYLKIWEALDIAVNGVELYPSYGVGHTTAPWPQHSPEACHKFKTACPYLGACVLDIDVIPSESITVETLSHSSMNTYLDCPERFRRERLDKMHGRERGGGSDASELGNAVHRGMAEIYRQLKERV